MLRQDPSCQVPHMPWPAPQAGVSRVARLSQHGGAQARGENQQALLSVAMSGTLPHVVHLGSAA